MPFAGALERTTPPKARDRSWPWSHPARHGFRDAERGDRRRHHLHETAGQRRLQRPVVVVEINKRATCPTLRHLFATPLLEDGYDLRTEEELLERSAMITTMMYTRVLNRGGFGVRSPLDVPAAAPDRRRGA